MNVVLLEVDDYEALYIDGIKRSENHRVNADDVLLLVEKYQDGNPITYQNFFFEPETDEEREEWEMGIEYPVRLEDVDPHLRQGIDL